jgi:DNA polymerase III delta subunit
MSADAAPAYLVRGDDPSLVAQEVRSLLARVVGDRDHALAVEEIGGSPADELNVGAIVDACLTPPFLVDLRVIVVRDAGRLLMADVPRLVDVVQEPLPTTVLVLVAGGGTIPAALVKAIAAKGEVVDVTTGKAGERKAWLSEHLRAAPVHLDRGATDLLADHVGEDLGRVEGLLSALSAAYGDGASVSADDL